MRHDNIRSIESHHRQLVDDPLTELIRQGARKLIEEALHAELGALLDRVGHLTTEDGRRRVVRNRRFKIGGFLPERDVQTGVGPVPVKVPRVRDRAGEGARRIRFTSSVLPRYMRKTRSLEALIPWLYLKGVSTGDFSEALAALLGRDAPGLSQGTISRARGRLEGRVRRLAHA